MTIALSSFFINAGELLQHVSRIDYRGTPLYYGRSATNRYDDPLGKYGVLYLGQDLATALMESVFHKHHWDRSPKRSISLAEIHQRMVRVVGVLEPLNLADLTAPGIMAGYFGLNLQQMTRRNYAHTQQVSAHVQAMHSEDGQPTFDGVLYPSRNNYPASSIALFEQANPKVTVCADIDLPDHEEWPNFVESYCICVEPDPGPAQPDDDAP